MAKQKSEIETLRTTTRDLDGLEPVERDRILKYVAEKYGFELVKKKAG